MSESRPQDRSKPLPVHVAIIMDGNGRWAQARGLPRLEGHRRGVGTVNRIVRAADELGIKFLTLYSFSTENWKRPLSEVTGLMQLFRIYIKRNLDELDRKNVRIQIIGEREGLEEDILSSMDGAVKRTKDNTGLTLVLAFNYGSRLEMTKVIQHLRDEVDAGALDPETLDEELFTQHLETAGIPDPELIIRTSGEKRLSNFLLWQAAHSQLYFTDTLWPDFQQEDLELALTDYART